MLPSGFARNFTDCFVSKFTSGLGDTFVIGLASKCSLIKEVFCKERRKTPLSDSLLMHGCFLLHFDKFSRTPFYSTPLVVASETTNIYFDQ